MKIKILIPILLLMAAIIFSQCKTCNCSYQPKKAKVSQTWSKR